MAEDRTHRIIRYLTDTHATEIGGIAALKDLLARATDPEVRTVVSEKIAVGRTQVNRLEARIRALGGSPSGAKAAVQATGARASRLMNLFHDQEDKQTQDLVKAYALTHFEVGVYTSLAAFADAADDAETARLAREIRAEEEAAAARLERLIPRVSVQALNRTAGVAAPGAPASASTSSGGHGGRETALVWLPLAVALGVWVVSRLLSGPDESDDGARAPGTVTDTPVAAADTVDRTAQ